MASITGDLSSVGVPELFRAIADDSKTGRLSITRSGPGSALEAHVYFRNGEAYHARMLGSGAQLGTRLVSAGLVSRQEIEEALWTQQGEGGARRLGEILVDDGLIPREKMEAIVREQIEDTIFEILRWEGGSFTFEPGAESTEDVGIEVSVENLVMEGARRFREWHQITRRVPTLDAVPKFAEDGDGAVEVALTPEEWSFVSALDGRSTVAELAKTCGFTDLEAARTVFGLVTAGLLELEQPEGVELPDEDPDLDAAFDELEQALQEASRERLPGDRRRLSLEELTGTTKEAPAKKRSRRRKKSEDEPGETESALVEGTAPPEAIEAEAVATENVSEIEAAVPEAEVDESAKLEAAATEAQRLEAERLQAERLQAERLQAERLQAERLEAERLQAERLEAERLEEEAVGATDELTPSPVEADRYAEVWAESRPEAPFPEETFLEEVQANTEAPAPGAETPPPVADERPKIKVYDTWGVAPSADRVAGETELPTVLAEEVVDGRHGSMARLFAELSSPLEESDFELQAPPVKPEPGEQTPAVSGNGIEAAAAFTPRPVDPDVDTTALIRELSAFAMDDEESTLGDATPSAPSPQPSRTEDKGRGLFGRRKR